MTDCWQQTFAYNQAQDEVGSAALRLAPRIGRTSVEQAHRMQTFSLNPGK